MSEGLDYCCTDYQCIVSTAIDCALSNITGTFHALFLNSVDAGRVKFTFSVLFVNNFRIPNFYIVAL